MRAESPCLVACSIQFCAYERPKNLHVLFRKECPPIAGSTRSLGIAERTKIHAGHVGWERHPQVGLEIRHSTRHHVLIGNDYFLPGDALVPKALVPDTLLHARNVCPDIHVEYRSEEHTSELQSLMRISYAVFCLKKQKTKN